MVSDLPTFSPTAPSAAAPSTVPPSGVLRRFRRITTSTAYIAEIDGLRFVAIAAVMFYHLPIALRYAPEPSAFVPWQLAGQLGVQLFFIISGFVLTLPFARYALQGGREVMLQSYFLRRLTRIEPPYIICLLLLFVLRNALSLGKIAPAHLLAGLFYVHSLAYGYGNPIDPVAWSLEVEVQFYLLVPLFAALFSCPAPARRRIFLFLISASIVMNAAASMQFLRPPPILQWTVLGYAHFFLIGMWLSEGYLAGKLKNSGLTWDFLAVTAVLAVVYAHSHRNMDQIVSALGLPVVFVAAFLGRWVNRLLRIPVIATIGGMCYSIYLLHHFVLQSAGVLVRHYPALERGGIVEYCAAALLLFPLMIGVSTMFYLLVERPCMDPRWPRKLVTYLAAGTRKSAAVRRVISDVTMQDPPEPSPVSTSLPERAAAPASAAMK